MSEPMSESEAARQEILEIMRKRIEKANEPVNVKQRRVREQTSASIVYSIRLDPEEVALLEERSSSVGLKPTVLARNLIRAGLATRNMEGLADAVDRLGQAVEEVRAFVR